MIGQICEGTTFRSPCSRFCYYINCFGAGWLLYLLQQLPGHTLVGLALAFSVSRTIDVHRGSDVGVPHEFLLHSHRGSQVIQERPVGMSKRIPSQVRDADHLTQRVQMIVSQRISMERPAGVYVRK